MINNSLINNFLDNKVLMSDSTEKKPIVPEWVGIVSKYNFPDPIISWWQIVNTLVPYIALWVLMYYSLSISYWLTLLLSAIAAGFLVRLFIIFHDCGHGSFFKSERMNRWVGIPLGLLSFTPYHRWHYDHKVHHQTVGNLDKRGIGDVQTLTVEEFKKLSKWEQFSYRFYRHPLFLIAFAPLLLFFIQYRLPKIYMNPKQHVYLQLSNLALAAMIILLILIMGFKAFILIQLPVMYFASVAGVWLFYVQHQYEHVIWKRSENWNYQDIALNGSSYFKLPSILRWFSGNIGFHHIHHLSPLIPNYKLRRCHNENKLFQQIKPITFWTSFKSLRFRLWDEKNQKLVGFNEVS